MESNNRIESIGIGRNGKSFERKESNRKSKLNNERNRQKNCFKRLTNLNNLQQIESMFIVPKTSTRFTEANQGNKEIIGNRIA